MNPNDFPTQQEADDEYADYLEDMRDRYPWADQEIDHDEQARRAYQEELIRLRKERF